MLDIVILTPHGMRFSQAEKCRLTWNLRLWVSVPYLCSSGGPNADIHSPSVLRSKRLPGRGLPKSTSWNDTPNIGSRVVLLK